VEKLAGTYRHNTEILFHLAPGKVVEIVRNDVATLRRYGGFQHHVIVWIFEPGTPQKEAALTMCSATQVA
jgi:hypothetical protein